MGEAALKREFERLPPREELTSIAALWRDYLWRYVEAGRQDPAVPYTEAARNLNEAIFRACDSRGKDGKMFFHQGRVWEINRHQFAANLQRPKPLFKISHAINFEDLFRIIDQVGIRTKGIGAVTIYDVTSRLAAYLGMEAEWLHFHAGVKEGLKALGVELPEDGKIHREDLPRFWHDKNMDLAESFFCGYRSEIERVVRLRRKRMKMRKKVKNT